MQPLLINLLNRHFFNMDGWLAGQKQQVPGRFKAWELTLGRIGLCEVRNCFAFKILEIKYQPFGQKGVFLLAVKSQWDEGLWMSFICMSYHPEWWIKKVCIGVKSVILVSFLFVSVFGVSTVYTFYSNSYGRNLILIVRMLATYFTRLNINEFRLTVGMKSQFWLAWAHGTFLSLSSFFFWLRQGTGTNLFPGLH